MTAEKKHSFSLLSKRHCCAYAQLETIFLMVCQRFASHVHLYLIGHVSVTHLNPVLSIDSLFYIH